MSSLNIDISVPSHLVLHLMSADLRHTFPYVIDLVLMCYFIVTDGYGVLYLRPIVPDVRIR